PLVIPAGQTSAAITGNLIDDNKYDTANRALTFTLGTPTNATLGATIAETLTIQQSDPPPTVAFSRAAQSVSEAAGTFSMTVTLSSPSNVATAIPFTLGGAATAGVDYSGVTASPLVIAAGQTSAVISGTLLAVPPSPDKTLVVTLLAPTNGALGS